MSRTTSAPDVHGVPAHAERSTPAPQSTDRSMLRVAERTEIADGVLRLRLTRPDGSRLPDWAPGAHIDLVLPDGRTRQYSLCGDRGDAHSYTVAIQREPHGRGGSMHLHDTVRAGDMLGFGGPRNTFRLAPAAEYLFIAGGVGITPMLPMIAQADQLRIPWRLLYLGRTRPRMAFADDLSRRGEHVHVHAADALGRAELDAWRPSSPHVRVYACGPERLLEAVRDWGAVPGGFAPSLEHFTASAAASAPTAAFEVVAARSGARVTVAADESIVQALHRIDVRVLTSCAQGVCGTCETDVLSGVPDHRDTLLDADERAAGTCLFPCVSRCVGAQLVLDV